MGLQYIFLKMTNDRNSVIPYNNNDEPGTSLDATHSAER